MLIARIAAVLIGYVLGLFETGYIFGKMKNTDIRQHGSGNAGSTNALRVFGIKGGLITFAGDLTKSILSVLIVWVIFKNSQPDAVRILMMYAGLGAILGHNFPFYLNFNGGKGIACTAGFVLAFCPIVAPIAFIAFFAIVLTTQYVSLGSLVAVTLLFLQFILFGNLGLINIPVGYLSEAYLIMVIITVLAFVRHRSNIVKLMKGTENKTSFKKKTNS